MRDRNGEPFARALDDAALEPVGAALRMRRDDDLVGAEGAQRVFDRLQRVAVADFAASFDAGLGEHREARVETFLRGCARAVLVGHPVPQR